MVSVVTRLQAEDLGNCGLILDRGKEFFSSHIVQTSVGSHLCPPFQWVRGAVGGKVAGA